MALRVDLRQASVPRPVPSNRLVASRQEIPMPRVVLIRCKAHDRNFAVAKSVRQCFRLGELLGPLGQVTAKGSGKIHGDFFRRSAPLPQLLPRLHQCLHLSGGSEARSTSPLARDPDGGPQRMILAYSSFVRPGRDGWGQWQSARALSIQDDGSGGQHAVVLSGIGR
jgi:hypothetical protein